MTDGAEIQLQVITEAFELASAFVISRGSKTHAEIVRVVASRGPYSGQGECVPYARYGETVDSVCSQIRSLPALRNRNEIQGLLPAGAARNAVDCALWDLESKENNMPAWRLAGIEPPGPVTTAFTLSLDTPENMAISARTNSDRPLLKVKLGTTEDLSRLQAVRDAAPEATIIVDANEGWDIETFEQIQPELIRLNIALVEQPLPEQDDGALRDRKFEIPICADESSHTSQGLKALLGKYDYINIKLDKTGGLTEALWMKQEAQRLGFGIFTGCMVATSLAMAPAILIAQNADYVDLDGPLLLAQDREHGLTYEGSIVHPATKELWG